MTPQPLPFRLKEPSSPKRVQETSRESLRDVMRDIESRQLRALQGLEQFIDAQKYEPTSSELMDYLGITDPNTLRPRLTELKAAKVRYVENSGRRRCEITDKSALTWRLTERGKLYLKERG